MLHNVAYIQSCRLVMPDDKVDGKVNGIQRSWEVSILDSSSEFPESPHMSVSCENQSIAYCRVLSRQLRA